MKKVWIFALLTTFWTHPAIAFSVTHDFTVLLGPFNASKTSFQYTLTPDSYGVTSEVETAGVFNTLYPFSAQYATAGKIKNGKLETSSYKYQSKSRFNRRSKELIYDTKGNPVYRLSSKNDKQKKVEINPSLKSRDTTDLQTVFAELARQYNKMHFCDSRMEVFDGKRRFDIIFKDEGKENIYRNKYSPYSGEASKCSMYIDKLGSSGDDFLWQLTSDKPVYFWIMEEPLSKVPFIAKIEIPETELGALKVYTRNLTVKD